MKKLIYFLFFLALNACDKQDFVRVAAVKTIEIKDVSYNSATVVGEVIDVAQGNINRGVCYSSNNPEPTIADALADAGNTSSTGNFLATITNLQANKNYYVRAFIRNGQQTLYGESKQFSTSKPTDAVIVTGTLQDSAYNSTKINSEIKGIGDTELIQYGHCYSTSISLPTTSDSKTALGKKTSIGTFTDQLNNLENNKTYYVRSYAQNSLGVYYGSAISFKLKPTLLTTNTIQNITQSTAQANATLHYLGTGITSLSEYGFCYSATNTTPTTNDTKVNLGSRNNTGSFSTTLNNLEPNKTYYLRTYANNGKEVIYGEVGNFVITSITTNDVSNISPSSATLNGTINALGTGVSSFSEYGFCYSTTNTLPTITDTKANLGSRSTTGTFSTTINNLETNKTYYVRTYANNGTSVIYGSVQNFTTQDYDPNTAEWFLYTQQRRTDWWNSLEDQWKKAYNFNLGRGEVATTPADVQITTLLKSTSLSIYSNNACVFCSPKMSFQLSNLSGIRYLTLLEYLYIDSHSVSNLEPVSNLKNLKTVSFTVNESNNNVLDISPLQNLTKLESIFTQSGNLKSLEPLRNLTNLTSLVLRNTNFDGSSLEPLKNLTNLTFFAISGKTTVLSDGSIEFRNSVSSLEPLKNLTKIEHLELSGMPIINLDACANYTNLTYLNCYSNKISNLESLVNLTNLTQLDCRINKLTSLKGLEKMTKLKYLYAKYGNTIPQAEIERIEKLLGITVQD